MVKLIVLLDKVNVPRIVGDHLLNKKRTDTHRMMVGIVVMSFGVCLSKVHTTMIVIQYFFDGLGYGIHGIGLTPFIEKITHVITGENRKPPRVK